MDSLNAGVAAMSRTVVTWDRDQIQQAVNNYREPGHSCHHYWLYHKKDGDGRDLLHYACMYNKDEVATWMLSLNAKSPWGNPASPIPKDSDKFGVTAVMYAARAGMVTFVTEWIKQECDINTVDKNGRNILHYCCGEGEVIKNLPEARRKQIDIDKDKMTQIVQLLIDNGVKFNYSSADNKGITPFKYLIDLKFDKYVSIIASDPDKAIQIWKNEIHETIGMLSSKQIYPHVKLENKQVKVFGGFMHLCVKECFIDNPKLSCYQRLKKFKKTILSCKLNVNEVDDNGMTALHYICYYKFDSEPFGLREGLVDKLLKLGVDPNIKDIRGCTPLMCGLEKGYIKIYESSDPRYASETAIGELLNVEMGSVETDVKINVKQNENMMEEMKKREDLYKQELDNMNEQFNQKIKDITAQLNDTRKELTEQLNDTRNELIEMQTSKDELQERLEKQIKDLQMQVKNLEMRNETEQGNIDVSPSSLLLGNLVLSDVARHLEADVEVICLPDASLEDLQAAVSDDKQKYKNLYLITENKNIISDLNNLIIHYRKLIDASKDKATKLIVASILPTLNDGNVNDSIERLNKELEAVCQETGCDFVNNDPTFKSMNGTIIEACFDEDGEILSGFGVKQLWRNLGLLTTKKKQQATNI